MVGYERQTAGDAPLQYRLGGDEVRQRVVTELVSYSPSPARLGGSSSLSRAGETVADPPDDIRFRRDLVAVSHEHERARAGRPRRDVVVSNAGFATSEDATALLGKNGLAH